MTSQTHNPFKENEDKHLEKIVPAKENEFFEAELQSSVDVMRLSPRNGNSGEAKKLASSIVQSAVTEAISTISSTNASISSHTLEGDGTEVQENIEEENKEFGKSDNISDASQSKKLKLENVPRKRIQAIFELDPSNQLCADCQTLLNPYGTDEIYLSFQYPTTSQHPSTSFPPKDFPVSEIWNNHNNSPLKPLSSPPNKSNSLFRMQHAVFSPYNNSPPVTFSVFICHHCAKAHRSILLNSRYKSNSQYSLKCMQNIQDVWSPQEIAFLDENKGNKHANSLLEYYMPPLFKERFSVKNIEKSTNDFPKVPNHVQNTNDDDLSSYLGGGIRFEEREVFVRAKYEVLAFLLPNGPLKVKPILSASEKGEGLQNTARVDNPKKDSYLVRIGGSKLDESDRQKRVLQTQVLPSRLVDYFCVIGTKGQLSPSFYTSLFDENHNMKKKIQSWEEVSLETEVIDSYPPREDEKGKDFYSDMNLPNQISKFVFPDGYQPARNQPKPTFFTFVLTLETGSRLYGASLRIYDQIFDPKLYNGLKDIESHIPTDCNDPLHIPKALVVLSHYPFFGTFSSFLKQLYRISRTPSSPLPLERYVANFTREVPLPPFGQVEIHYGLSDELSLIKIMRPPINKLPLVNFSYRPLFSCLSVSNIMVIFACLLQESRVVICSSHYSLLTPICEALLSLLFPFVWQGCYIPVMPYNMLDVLEAPFPYLIGLHSRFLKGEHRPHGVVIVDTDEDIVHLGYEDEDPGSKDQTIYGRRTPALPEKSAMKLRNNLEEAGGAQYIMPTSKMKGRITYGDSIFTTNE